MTVEEILAALQAIVAEATNGADPDPNAAPALNSEQMDRYEKLEAQLAVARRSEETMKRNAAYRTNVTNLPINGSAGKKATNADLHSAAFRSYFMTGQIAQEQAMFRAQSEGVGSAGGFLVPVTLRDKIIERLKDFGGFGVEAEQFTTAQGNPINYVTNDDTANLGAIVAENALITTGADLVFGERSLGAYKYAVGGASSLPLKVSWELLQDSEFDLEAFISKKLGERLARKFSTDWVNGTGIGEPQGILNGGLSAASAIAANTGPTYAELVNIVHTLDPAYRKNAKWAFNDKTMALIEKLVDSDGRPLIWNTSNQLSEAPNDRMLLGYPVVIDQAFPDPLGSNKFGFFGDISQTYIVRHVKDMQLVTLHELYAQNGQVGYLAWARMDGMVQDPNAGILLTAAA